MGVNPADADAYVRFAAAALGLPLSEQELAHAARRAVQKRIDLEPLYAALTDTDEFGATTFRVANS
jgi:hypothetical protein